MEKTSFDARARSVSEWLNRRSIVKAAGTGALAALLGATLDPTATDAKRRRVRGEHNIRGNKAIMCVGGKTVKVPKKKRKKYLKQGATRGKCNGCTPVCTPGTCGDDGCGGTCPCVDGTVCLSGTCTVCDVSCVSGDSAACGEELNTAIALGGTILVCPGTYEGPFPLTQNVEIIGSGSGNNPASNTILIGAVGSGSVVPVTGAVTARLASLRITGGNGAGTNSGGVYVNNAAADVTIEDCALIENNGFYGAGVSVYSGLLTITGCDISDNTATGSGGGLATASTSTIENTTFTNNTSTLNGGGVFVNSGTATLGSGVTITQNAATGLNQSGGGIYKFSAGATINNSATVVNNSPDNCAGNGFTCP